MLAADYVRYETWTQRVAVDPAAPDTVRAVFAQMREALREGFARLGIDRSPSFTIQLDMRLVGQAFEVAVAIPVECLGDLTTCGLFDRFRDAHHRVFEFGESDHDRAEIVSFRLGAAVAPDAIPPLAGTDDSPAAEASTIALFDRGEELSCLLLTRPALPLGESVAGPILVDDVTATIYVPRGWQAERDRHDNLILRRAARDDTRDEHPVTQQAT